MPCLEELRCNQLNLFSAEDQLLDSLHSPALSKHKARRTDVVNQQPLRCLEHNTIGKHSEVSVSC